VETEHLRRLTDKSPALGDRVREALRQTVLDALRSGVPACDSPMPEGVPEYRRPDWDTIRAVFAAYDRENDGDRTLMAENRGMLRELLSEHWITLRPVLRGVLANDAPVDRGARTYGACVDMSGKLSRMLLRRRNTVGLLEEELSESLDVLRSQGNDWVCGRAGMESVTAWTEKLDGFLSDLFSHLRETWEADTEAYRGLLAAYTAERERLFRLDTCAGGFFAETWSALLEGALPESVETAITVASEELDSSYRELWRSVCRLSRGIDALMHRIRSRAAESRAARDISDRPELFLDALRGAAYEDPAWGKAILSVMDTAARNDFRTAVRRWQESFELSRRQEEAYKEYSALYARFTRPS
jgi:hypothetical protein